MEVKSKVSGAKYAADITSIREAQERISPYAHKTPVLSSETLNSISGRKLYFKCELFQKGGAFKFRGACNAVFSLTDDEAAKGVVTHSSGNHAAALSLAAKLRGIAAHIVIPKNAPRCKVENVMRYGGQIVWSEAAVTSRENVASKVMQDTGAVLIHPYNDRRIMRKMPVLSITGPSILGNKRDVKNIHENAYFDVMERLAFSGQGTVSLEFLEQVPQLDTIIVPVSGGGLISGVAIAAKSINPAIRILAAEPRGADDAARSKEAGRIVTLPDTKTIADGLRAFLGDLTWPVVRDLVDDIIIVEDKEIIEAMKLCYQILKVTVEPSGAIVLAAVLSHNFKNNPKWRDCGTIGLILSGGNVDLDVLWKAFS